MGRDGPRAGVRAEGRAVQGSLRATARRPRRRRAAPEPERTRGRHVAHHREDAHHRPPGRRRGPRRRRRRAEPRGRPRQPSLPDGPAGVAHLDRGGPRRRDRREGGVPAGQHAGVPSRAHRAGPRRRRRPPPPLRLRGWTLPAPARDDRGAALLPRAAGRDGSRERHPRDPGLVPVDGGHQQHGGPRSFWSARCWPWCRAP